MDAVTRRAFEAMQRQIDELRAQLEGKIRGATADLSGTVNSAVVANGAGGIYNVLQSGITSSIGGLYGAIGAGVTSSLGSQYGSIAAGITASIGGLYGAINTGVTSSLGSQYGSIATGITASIGGLYGAINTGITASLGSQYGSIATGITSSIGGLYGSLGAGITASLGSQYGSIATGITASIGGLYGSLGSGITSSLGSQYGSIATGITASIGGLYGAISTGQTSSINVGLANVYGSINTGVTASVNSLYGSVTTGNTSSLNHAYGNLQLGHTASLNVAFGSLQLGTTGSVKAGFISLQTGVTGTSAAHWNSMQAGTTASLNGATLNQTLAGSFTSLSGTTDSVIQGGGLDARRGFSQLFEFTDGNFGTFSTGGVGQCFIGWGIGHPGILQLAVQTSGSYAAWQPSFAGITGWQTGIGISGGRIYFEALVATDPYSIFDSSIRVVGLGDSPNQTIRNGIWFQSEGALGFYSGHWTIRAAFNGNSDIVQVAVDSGSNSTLGQQVTSIWQRLRFEVAEAADVVTASIDGSNVTYVSGNIPLMGSYNLIASHARQHQTNVGNLIMNVDYIKFWQTFTGSREHG